MQIYSKDFLLFPATDYTLPNQLYNLNLVKKRSDLEKVVSDIKDKDELKLVSHLQWRPM